MNTDAFIVDAVIRGTVELPETLDECYNEIIARILRAPESARKQASEIFLIRLIKCVVYGTAETRRYNLYADNRVLSFMVDTVCLNSDPMFKHYGPVFRHFEPTFEKTAIVEFIGNCLHWLPWKLWTKFLGAIRASGIIALQSSEPSPALQLINGLLKYYINSNKLIYPTHSVILKIIQLTEIDPDCILTNAYAFIQHICKPVHLDPSSTVQRDDPMGCIYTNMKTILQIKQKYIQVDSIETKFLQATRLVEIVKKSGWVHCDLAGMIIGYL
jgi:hypothetical protein